MKTSELIGPALNWAVGLANGWKRYDSPCQQPDGTTRWVLMFEIPGQDLRVLPAVFKFSTDWAQGGPIIEREKIDIECGPDGDWEATSWIQKYGELIGGIQFGPTPLIAGMRCYVASKLGDEVEIPDELV